jgi:hypothetical protein
MAVTMALAGALVLVGGPPAGAATTDNHYISNLDDSTAPKKLGFTIFDTGSSRAEIAALPDGVRALVWLGEKCPTRADAAFRRTVDRLAHKARVFGYYLSDEPHVDECPGGPAALATRARYIRRASGGTQRSFIVLDKHNSNYKDYTAFRPQVTRVSLVGLDAYPCNVDSATCEFSKINERVNAATKRNFPLRKIVPVYQAFGQENTSDPYYRLPTAQELNRILARWAKLVPNPRMDYTYSWGNQGSANPTLKDSEPLKNVLQTYFAS